jgi:predicted nucleic acid-binding protein
MLTVIFDAGPLITACKFSCQDKPIIDHLLPGCRIVIAPSVEREVAILGARYPDGVLAGRRISQGEILVVSVAAPKWAQLLRGYALGDGERDSIELCPQVEADALITDDYLAFIAATRLALKVWMLPDLVMALSKRNRLTIRQAGLILEAVQTRYRKGVIEHSLAQLQEVKNAQSSGSH